MLPRSLCRAVALMWTTYGNVLLAARSGAAASFSDSIGGPLTWVGQRIAIAGSFHRSDASDCGA